MKFEVRKEGVECKARRPMEYDEFLNLLLSLRCDESLKLKSFRLSSVITLQWHMISRIDDMMKLKFENITSNVQNGFTLLCKMCWSKNITEERDAPEQIIMGSMDAHVCPILNLATYLETEESLNQYVFGNPMDGHRIVRENLNLIFEKETFKKLKDGKLGTHSLRKGPATYASRCGLSKDYVAKRGRWRTKKSIVDTYIDPTLPYPDACTAATLCGPLGACKYKLKSNSPLVADFLITITKESSRYLGDRVGAVLAIPLIWAAYEEIDSSFVLLPSSLRNRIKSACIKHGLHFDSNPVERIPVHPIGDGNQKSIVELNQEEESIGEATASSKFNNGMAMMSLNLNLQR